MDTKNIPPAAILDAATTLLAHYYRDLTPTWLVAALRAFEPETAGAKRDAAPPSPMLSLGQAAATLAVSVDTVRRMVKDGRLPGRKVAKLWRIPAAAVRALAEIGEV